MQNKNLISTLPSDNFPPLLKEIPDPPEELFYRGTLPDWGTHKFLCVVGARKYTSYGKEACEKLVTGLAGFPIVIVSGLALGIDGVAHRAALATGLKTVAVLGSGLAERVIYPHTHLPLASDIISQGGILLSEFPPDFRATTWSFPQRNRIMAGLSHAVLVVEAEKKSGTLITARLATEYNRDVLTVPGSVFSVATEGPHLLLRLGATPVRSSEDILDALGFEPKAKSSQLKAESYKDCSAAEKKIIELLTEPRPKDDLIRLSGMSASQANATLSVLEIKGLIKESMGEVHLT